MGARVALVWRLSVRPLCRDRRRSLLAMIGIALGVALVASVNLQTARAREGARQSGSLMNRSDREIVSALNRSFEASVYGRLLPVRGVVLLPVLHRVVDLPGGHRAPLVGTDLVKLPYFLDRFDREGLGTTGGEGEPFSLDGVMLTAGLAGRLGLGPGDTLGIGGSTLRVLAVVRSDALETDAVVCDIDLAGRLFGSPVRIDSIQVRLRRGVDGDAVLSALAGRLPPELLLRRPEDRLLRTRDVLRAFDVNLKALSFMALLIGMFLVYNTMLVSVARRRSEIGVWRALGMRRTEVLGLLLCQALAIGAPGALIGVAAGRLLTDLTAPGVAETLRGHYGIPLLAAAGGFFREAAVPFGLGVAGALLSSLPPAVEATRIAPAETMREGSYDERRRRRSRRRAVWGLGLAVAGLAVAFVPVPGRIPVAGFGGLFIMTTGFVLLSAWVLRAATGLARRGLRRRLGPGGRIGSDHLSASAPRTAPAVAAVAVSLACTVGILMLIHSFRRSVEDWVVRNLSADLYVTDMACGPRGLCEEGLPEDRVTALSAISGVRDIYRFRGFEMSFRGQKAFLGVSDTALIKKYDRFELLSDRSAGVIYRELGAGRYALVSEPFRRRFGVAEGDRIDLPTRRGPVAFTVSGVFRDYFSELGYVVIDRRFLAPLFGVADAHSLALYLEPGADRDAVARSVVEVMAGRPVAIARAPEIRGRVLAIFDRTFFVTRAIYLISLLIALLGVVSSLYTLVLDRRRDLAVLRYLGMDRGQLLRMLLAQSGFIAGAGAVLGLVMGGLLGLVRIFVINRQSFGWSVDLHLPLGAVAAMTAGLTAAAMLAAVLPFREAARLRPERHISSE